MRVCLILDCKTDSLFREILLVRLKNFSDSVGKSLHRTQLLRIMQGMHDFIVFLFREPVRVGF